jgi:hypothetical protein
MFRMFRSDGSMYSKVYNIENLRRDNSNKYDSIVTPVQLSPTYYVGFSYYVYDAGQHTLRNDAAILVTYV